MTATDPISFDAATATATAWPVDGGAVPFELPPDLQRHGVLWPTPADMVSDHSAEGAPWLPTARAVPQDPPQGPLWTANHDGPSVPFDAQQGVDALSGQAIAAPATGNHDGTQLDKARYPAGLPVIGQPFTVNQGSRETRTLATDQWDATGKRVNPPDAPSAPHEIYGSQHDTTPRFIPFQVGALFANVGDSNQFSVNPGYWGVNASVPDMAPRPFGAVAAQMPSDPYVADSVTGPAVPGAVPVDYGWEY